MQRGSELVQGRLREGKKHLFRKQCGVMVSGLRLRCER